MGDGTFGSRLLIVDDEPSIGRPIKRVGKGSGFEAVVAEDPGGLAGMARSWHPTVIIITLKMPGIDGIQLLRDRPPTSAMRTSSWPAAPTARSSKRRARSIGSAA